MKTSCLKQKFLKDAEFVRKTYVKLFDEKAQELNKLEKDFDECKKKLEIADRKIMDSEYRGTKT